MNSGNSTTNFETKEILAKSILVKSKLPGTDYVINPYIGCRFGCTYCYASFMGRQVGKKVNDWGNYVYAKINAPELLRKEVKRFKRLSPENEKSVSIFISSVTDPYQGLEAKYKLTRQCLEILLENDFKGEVALLTKSDLVLRDIDILQKLHNSEVGFTITTTEDGISRYFEKFAPSANQRIKALKKINEAGGIRTYAFIGPLLPHYAAEKDKLEGVIKAIAETGTKELYVEHINLSKYILDRLKSEMKDMDQNTWDTFYASKNESYREALNEIIFELVKKYRLKLRLGGTIYHPDL